MQQPRGRTELTHRPKRTSARLLRAACIIATLCTLAACATRPPATAFDRPVTHALPASETTPLGTALAPLEKQHPYESGMRLLPTGTDALQARIALARAATKTLDMQYYIANEDNSGKLLLAAALYAADRGARVRMLVDTRKDAVTMPAIALQRGPDGYYVWVVKSDDTVEQRPIQALIPNDEIVIATTGLNAGETVVLEGQSRLDVGVHVSVRSPKAPAPRQPDNS